MVKSSREKLQDEVLYQRSPVKKDLKVRSDKEQTFLRAPSKVNKEQQQS